MEKTVSFISVTTRKMRNLKDPRLQVVHFDVLTQSVTQGKTSFVYK
jgi:hypothetical protein